MEALLTGAAVFGAIVLSKILEPALYRFTQRNEALDHFTQNRWDYVKHTDIGHFRRDIEHAFERVQLQLNKLNDFTGVEPENKLEGSATLMAKPSPAPRSI